MLTKKETIEIGTVVRLNEDVEAECRALATSRYESNRKHNIRNQKIGKQSNEFTDLQGIGGEFAFCAMIGVDPDTTIYPRSSLKDKGDLLLPDGRKVDIKTTHYKDGKLLVVPWKAGSQEMDLYGLMVGTFPEFQFKGVIESKKILLTSKMRDMGYGPTYAAEQNELKDLII